MRYTGSGYLVDFEGGLSFCGPHVEHALGIVSGEKKNSNCKTSLKRKEYEKGVASPLGRILLDDYRLATIAIKDEGGMRIDYRENCGGHLKTCNGEDNEALLFADWTSLHLDIVASDRGLKRFDASFYHLVLNSTVNPSGSSHG
jgi:hypothetical protein